MKAAVSKTVLGVKPLTWVRIPPSPPPGGQLGSQLGRHSQPSHEPALHVGFRRVLHGHQQPTITKSVKPNSVGLEQQRRRHRPGTAPIPACPWAGSRIPPSPPLLVGRVHNWGGTPSNRTNPRYTWVFDACCTATSTQPSPNPSSPAAPALSSSVEDTGQNPHTNSTPTGPALKSPSPPLLVDPVHNWGDTPSNRANPRYTWVFDACCTETNPNHHQLSQARLHRP